jgi:F-type H+-transporting ATPase subunit b
MVFLLAFAESAIQLVPDGTIIFHILLILLMVWVLDRTLFKPINQVLAEREAQTAGSSSEAHAIVVNVREKTRDYEQRLREARSEGYQMLEKRKLESLREREQKITELKTEITNWSEERKAELNKEAQNARVTLEKSSRELAVSIASRILKRPLN